MGLPQSNVIRDCALTKDISRGDGIPAADTKKTMRKNVTGRKINQKTKARLDKQPPFSRVTTCGRLDRDQVVDCRKCRSRRDLARLSLLCPEGEADQLLLPRTFRFPNESLSFNRHKCSMHELATVVAPFEGEETPAVPLTRLVLADGLTPTAIRVANVSPTSRFHWRRQPAIFWQSSTEFDFLDKT